MKERKEIISIGAANVWSVVVMALAAVAGLPYFWFMAKALGYDAGTILKHTSFAAANSANAWWMPLAWCVAFIAVLALGIVVHELIHGITWGRYCKQGRKSITFGVKWKQLMPYCHCSEPLKKRDYLTGVLMPFLVVGILPLLASPLLGCLDMCLLGIIFIASAAGDLMIAWRLRKENPTNTILDHPTEPGYLVYEDDNAPQQQ